MKTFYFTFGTDHRDKDGDSLFLYVFLMKAHSESQARALMYAIRDNQWSQVYDTPEEAGVSKYDLTPLNRIEDIILPPKEGN